MFWLLTAYLVAGLVVMMAGRRLGASSYGVAAVPFAATLVWLLWRRDEVAAGIDETIGWVDPIGLELALRVDGLAALLLLVVAGVGVLVVAYSWRYFSGGAFDGHAGRPGRLIGLLVLFGGSMAGLVVADNLIVLYACWELTSITSFFLIGDDHRDPRSRAAALQALLVTGLGGLAMLAGFVLLGIESGTYQLSAILADPPSSTITGVALALILLGAFTKSAQYPFQSWLPAAMVAPTPVSTYLHSATMVKAGVYLIARLAPAFVDVVGWWRPVVVTVGVGSLLLGGLRALRETDLKLLLAMGTISQLGLMIAVFGWGSAAAAVAGSALLLGHALYKAAAFMVVGILDHQHGTRDLRRLPSLGRRWSSTVVVTVVAAASMAGIPLLLGFVVKEAAFETFAGRGAAAGVALGFLVAGSALTAAYSYRFGAGSLGRLATDPVAGGRPPSASFVAPAALLTVGTLSLGVWPGAVDGMIDAAARALVPAVEAVHLALWHGLNVPLLLSAVALAGGAAIVVVRRARRSPPSPIHVPSSAAGYRAALRGLNALANRVTAIAQPGSLPLYLGVILLTAALVPGVLLVTGTWWQGWPQFVDIPAHVPLAVLLVATALAAAIVRQRFSGALFLGVAGYTMAGLFVAEGAPDLALTQVAIETLTTVLFVLVLRRLPDRFDWRRRRRLAARAPASRTAMGCGGAAPTVSWRPAALRRTLRVGVAVTVAVVAFAMTMAVGSLDPSEDVSATMVDEALPEGDGRNVVNVILVDIRGLDTLAEITVLAAAAIGTVALARAGRGPSGARSAEAPPEQTPPPVRLTRLVTIDVSVRVVFAAVLVGSIWLLFAGHNQPGGGFVGGIVASAALALLYAQGGLPEVRRLSRGKPWLVLGAGLVLSVGTAIVPLVLGAPVLTGGAVDLDLPVLGATKLTSALIFDTGVYLVVIGLAMMVFESFGDDTATEARP